MACAAVAVGIEELNIKFKTSDVDFPTMPC